MKPIDLQRIESRSWRSAQQTGLLDLYLGILLFALFAASLVSDLADPPWLALLTLLAVQGGGLLFFRWGRRVLVEPRIGKVRFGPQRIRNLRRLRAVLIVCTVITVGIVLLTALRYGGLRGLLEIFGVYGMPVLVAFVVGLPVAAIAYVLEVPRLLVHAAALIGSFFVRAVLEPVLAPMLVSLFAHGGAAAVSLSIGGTLLRHFLRRTPRTRFPEGPDEE